MFIDGSITSVYKNKTTWQSTNKRWEITNGS